MATKTTSQLIFIRGLPGGGKSHLSKILAESLADSKVVLLDPDSVDQSSKAYKHHVQQQHEDGVDPKLHLYRYLRAQAFEAIKGGKIVIWNQPFNNPEVFQRIYDQFEDFARRNQVSLTIKITEVDIDPNLAWQRITNRKAEGGHGPSREVFNQFVRDFTSLKGEKYNVINVNGSDSVEKSVKTVLGALEK